MHPLTTATPAPAKAATQTPTAERAEAERAGAERAGAERAGEKAPATEATEAKAAGAEAAGAGELAARVERLLSVEALDLSVAPNGDQVYWLAIGLRCRLVEGEARVNDDESVEVGWFDPKEMPPLPPHQARCLRLALADDAAPWI